MLSPEFHLTPQGFTPEAMLAEQHSLLIRLARQNNLSDLFECVLREAQQITNADGGTLYLLKGEGEKARLAFTVMVNDSLGININGARGDGISLPPLPLFLANGERNLQNVATYAALNKQTVNIPNVRLAADFDFSGARRFDQRHGYDSRSFLTVPLIDHHQDVIGVIQLINAKDLISQEIIPFDANVNATVEAMASFAAIALDNQILIQSHKDLLDSFIKSLAKITDVRSPHTSAHCQRIPLLTEMIAQAACEDQSPYFKAFNLTKDEWYELNVAAWMHDCGKLATPDFIVEKSTKLETVRDGLEAVRARIQSLKNEMDIEHLQELISKPGRREELELQLKLDKAQLDEDLRFLTTINKGGEFMSDESIDRVKALALKTWKTPEGTREPLLTEDEVLNLCIRRGTINDEERRIINRHIDITIDVLESLPFPKHLKRVPEYAGAHHEKMDGTGYPKGLTRDQMSLPARMMAVADIFEALTAKERPYKQPMPLSQAFSILARMRDENHIDPDVFDLFLKSKKWKDYGQLHMLPEQMDVEDVSGYLRDAM